VFKLLSQSCHSRLPDGSNVIELRGKYGVHHPCPRQAGVMMRFKAVTPAQQTGSPQRVCLRHDGRAVTAFQKKIFVYEEYLRK